MLVDLNIPKPIEETLRRELGTDLEPAVLEALAIESYRRGKLSLGQFAEMLGVTTDEADGILKSRGLYLDVTLPEIRDDLASLRELMSR